LNGFCFAKTPGRGTGGFVPPACERHRSAGVPPALRSERAGETPNPVLSPARERWHTFPLASALRSTCSAADHSALFAGFKATMASSDFPRPCIIGYGSSPSRCGPQASSADGQTWDLPVSDAILPRVMCSSTPAGWTGPRMTVQPMLRSITNTISAPTSRRFRGSITHPTQQLCALRGRRDRRLTQHSPPAGSLRLTGTGLAPANRASLLAPSLVLPAAHRPGGALPCRIVGRCGALPP